MRTISTAALICIIALASSLSVVVQAASLKPHECTDWEPATGTTCRQWAKDLNNMNPDDLKLVLSAYNIGVNKGCTNLVTGKKVRVFLL